MTMNETKTRIRKATEADIDAISSIYEEIHDREEAGEVTIGWERDVYPIRDTAVQSVARGDMYVQEDQDGCVVGTGIINRIQVDVYAEGAWEHPAKDEEVMGLHTLVISKKTGAKGLGTEFLMFYENYARENGCPYLRLDTNEKNAAARAFYRKYGYREIGIVPTVFNGIPGVNLVLIEKKLD